MASALRGNIRGQIKGVPGCGKTTTLVEIANNHIPRTRRAIFCSFGRDIYAVLNERLPKDVDKRTLNSLGFLALRQMVSCQFKPVDKHKTYKILDEYLTDDDYDMYATGLFKLIGLAKAHGIVPQGVKGVGLTMDTEQNWADLISKYDIEFEGDSSPVRAIELARRALTASIRAAVYISLEKWQDQKREENKEPTTTLIC